MRPQLDEPGLLVIDVQEKLLPRVERPCDVMAALQLCVKSFLEFKFPIVVSEQCPEKLGSTVRGLKSLLPEETLFFAKSTFSCLGQPSLKEMLLRSSVKRWVLVGLEAHICILQTAKDLLGHDKECIVLNDAISSRSIFDYSTAIGELRDLNVRVTSTETLLFEFVKDANSPYFNVISELVKA